MKFRTAPLLVLLVACGPDEHSGQTRAIDLPDGPEPSGGSGGSAGEGAGGDAGAGAVIVVPAGPPEISAMMPLSGPYGTEVRVQGENFGSAAAEGALLTLGSGASRELDPGSAPEIVSWNDTEIVFRFPFPLSGAVVVTTSQGTADAGDFEPSWIPGASLEAPEGVAAVSSIAPAPGTISAVLDTGPPMFVEFDGEAWSSSEISDGALRAETVRLYLEGSTLSAFALSAATSHEIIALDPADAFAATPSGVDATSIYTISGGHNGASVWFRETNSWSRARPAAGVWAVDKGPIADPNPSGSRHTQGTTDNGALFIGWAESTGDTLDDLGAVFIRQLPPESTTFNAKARSGIDVDDSVSSFTITPRGSAMVTRYCGTDKDPLGVTDDDLLCYAGLTPVGVQSTVKESATLRYGFHGNDPIAAYCSQSQGTRLVTGVGNGTSVAALDALPGEIVAWPCAPIVAIEADEDGELLVILEHDGALYSPRPRVP
jgi:hypothetical protein